VGTVRSVAQLITGLETGVVITPRQLSPWAPDSTMVGEWWPENQPELRYPGNLTTGKGAIVLTVTAPPIGQEVFAIGSTSTLLGAVHTDDGVLEVTLWDRAGYQLEHARNGTDHSKTFTHAIVGAHIQGYDAANFKYSAVTFNDLGNWGRFRTPMPQSTPDSELPFHTAATLRPYGDLFEADYSVSVQLEYPGRVETNSRFPHGAMINHQDRDARVVFEVDPPAPALFHELLANDFQALLTFCYQSGAPVIGEWIGSDSAELRPYYRKDTFKDRDVRHLGHFQMVLTPFEVPFGRLVEAWWNVLDEYFPAAQVLTIYLHGTRGVLEQSTASVLAATENIHTKIGLTQTRFDSEVIEGNRRKIKSALPGAANSQFRAFLGEKLQENRPTLNTRLQELAALVGQERFAALSIDSNEWIDRFKAIRNKLAHTGAHVPRRGDPSDELELINAQTRPVLALLILSQMRVSEEVLNRAARTLGGFPHRMW
jgi:hypothetical protein